MGKRNTSSAHLQKGGGLAEFSLAAMLLLALGMGAVEVAHWMSVRQVISLALLQAARAGAVAHGNPAHMEASFDQALSPLFTPAESTVQRRRIHQQEVQSALAGPPWHIAVLSPHSAAYLDFDAPPDTGYANAASAPRASAPAAAHLPRIDNDYQALQHRRYLAHGWPQGRGPRSGQTIYEANTLTLALTYPHRPLLPTTRALLRMLPADDAYAGRALRHGYLPLSRRISLSMQSHPAQWPSLASGKITAADAGQTAGGGISPGGPSGPCPSCQAEPPPGMPNSPGAPAPGGLPEPGYQNPSDPYAPGGSNTPPGSPGNPLAPPDTELCGIALCCAD